MQYSLLNRREASGFSDGALVVLSAFEATLLISRSRCLATLKSVCVFGISDNVAHTGNSGVCGRTGDANLVSVVGLMSGILFCASGGRRPALLLICGDFGILKPLSSSIGARRLEGICSEIY